MTIKIWFQGVLVPAFHWMHHRVYPMEMHSLEDERTMQKTWGCTEYISGPHDRTYIRLTCLPLLSTIGQHQCGQNG